LLASGNKDNLISIETAPPRDLTSRSGPMGRFVIAADRPLPGGEERFFDLTREHLPILHADGLVTDRPTYVMSPKDGTVVEVFGWKSAEAIASAHDNPQVQAMWQRYAVACQYVSLTTLEAAHAMLAVFEPLDLESLSGWAKPRDSASRQSVTGSSHLPSLSVH
jgi:hypothetical protein